MKYPIKIYILISIACFLVLSAVQYELVSNTYELTNERFYYAEIGRINELYSLSIRNDKLYPGARRILDSIFYARLDSMESLYNKDTTRFRQYTQIVMNDIFQQLRARQNMDSLMRQIKKQTGITDSLDYALTIKVLDIPFQENKYVHIYSFHQQNPLISPDIQTPQGARIAGHLKELNDQNLVTNLVISTPVVRNYSIIFTLNVEPHNRKALIFRKMSSIYLLSLIPILILILIFYITFRNWLQQKKLSEMKSDFINNITHEFHTPLAAIMVANKNLQNEKILENKSIVRSLTDVIQRQSDRLKILIEQVLDLTTRTKLLLKKESYEVNSLIDEILIDYHIKLSDPAIELIFTEKDYPDNIELDKFYFTTMLMNIIDNGIKYNNSETKIITLSTQTHKEYYQINVEDNGIGMKEDTIRLIFEKFYRHSKSLLQTQKGLGLGLYYVRQCIEAHHWQISVKSEPGKGSQFNITIPKVNI